MTWIRLRPRLLYGLFGVLAFAVALRLTFPAEAVKERLIYEAGAQGWQIDVQRVRPGALLGVRMDGVALTDAAGLRVPVDRLDAWLEPLPLLLGKRAVGFRAAVFAGAVEGRADLSGASRRITAQLRGVELERILPLRRAAGMGFLGRANGRVDLTLPGGLLEKASGAVELGISQAGMASGQVPIPGMASGLTLPALSFGAMSASAKLDQGRVAVERLEAKGGDAELSTEGVAFVLQPRLEFAPLTGRARIRFQAGLWQKPGAAALRPLVEAGLASSKAGDGSYGLLLSGNLGHPQIRPGTGGPAAAPAAAAAQ